MTNKYKVSQELMNDINNWRGEAHNLVDLGEGLRFGMHPNVYVWWWGCDTPIERNNRLIALIRYVNGEDVFEVEEPKKWIVRSKYTDFNDENQFLGLINGMGEDVTEVKYAQEILLTRRENGAFKFDSKEEAEQFLNPLMEVIEW